MKLGIAISILIVLLIGAFFVFGVRGVADPATSATSKAKLARLTLPVGTPFTIDFETTGNANVRYADVFRYFRANQRDLNSDEPIAAKADELIGKFIYASKAPDVTKPFLDDQIPLEAGGGMVDEAAAFELAPQSAMYRADELWRKGDKARAQEAAKAVWLFGQRAFEHSTRFSNRYNGIGTMLFVYGTMQGWDPALAEPMRPWADPLMQGVRAWEEKISVVRSNPPKVGDLLNVARHDEDLTFRIEATLWLGVARWNPRTTANEREIDKAIEEASASSDPTLAKAAQYARTLTREQLRRIR